MNTSKARANSRSARTMQQTDALRERMREALHRSGKSATQVAIAIGRDPNYFRDFLKANPKKNSVSSNDLKQFADQTAVRVEWLHGVQRTFTPLAPSERAVVDRDLPYKLIPLYGCPLPGEDDGFPFSREVLAELPCPPFLDKVKGAYALGVAGESMEPRYRPGEVAFVSSSRAARRGDDVVVQIEANGQLVAYIKELVQIAPDEVVLKQHNPHKELRFPRRNLHSIHVISSVMCIC
jgi:SOS-response transcriptional repressor LexA